uniref:Uncharacterized protein n=1 Tax=Strigamia maritima TaxID=126957 RepID=T1JGG0_STRMM
MKVSALVLRLVFVFIVLAATEFVANVNTHGFEAPCSDVECNKVFKCCEPLICSNSKCIKPKKT